MTQEDIDAFEKVQTQLNGLHSEISALSKKSQNDALNKFKLRFVNQILSQANKVLGDVYKPFKDFDLFDETEMPTTSDTAMMLMQYLSCFEKLRADNVKNVQGYWYWIIEGRQSSIRTTMPKRIKEK